MFPSKSMLDYMTEMNRLFPKTNENDLLHSANYGTYTQSPLRSTFFNRSSSSADSTSPESYLDIFTPTLRSASELFNIRPETPIQSFLVPRKQRAIVGRKILGNSEHTQTSTVDHEINFNSAWSDELSATPPTEQKYQARNYELFPSEKTYEMRSPNKILSGLSPMTPPFSVDIPRMASSPQPIQSLSHRYTPPRLGFSPPFFSGASSSKPDEIASSKMCTFCRKNGEAPLVYMTHAVKEKIGNQNVVTCPILRSHICSTCGATGDNAHTITYCPVLRSSNNGRRLQSTTITLKNTRIKSNGRRRY